jgi:acyl-CoA thioesterase-2
MSSAYRFAGVFARLVALEALGDDRFLAPPSPDRGGRTYGGQHLAQGLAACQRTVSDDRAVHSLHALFLSSGVPERATELAVERLRDGRSFSQRVVSARQDGREVLRMLTSFHVAEPGDEYAGAVMPAVPAPESVPFTYTEYTLRESGLAAWAGAARPMDIRYVNPPSAPRGVAVTEDQRLWMRIDEPLADDPAVHAAGLAYLADSTIVDHILLPHGERWQDPQFAGASLDHAMWFHRPARADEWLLFDQRAEATGGARGLASGRFFDRSGRLVATCLQEGLARWVR